MQLIDFDCKDCYDIRELASKFENDESIKGAKCNVCGKLHDKRSEDFFTIVGNIMIGLRGGLVGSNLKKDGTIGGIFVICAKKECIDAFTQRIFYDNLHLFNLNEDR